MLCQLQEVGLCYRRRFGRTETLKERVLLWLRGARASEPFWALDSITLQIRAGESVGLIGTNGSGKSSLLKLMAGIYPPDRGSMQLQGRVAALLELGAGFQPDLTGRENVFLYGAILGLDEALLAARLQAILDFSELGALIDTPVRHYSSGMLARLGFAVVAHLDAEILLIDEILAVGDFNFQQKCIDTMVRWREEGRTLLFVSHDMEAIRKLCRRAVWLEAGKVRQDGAAEEVLESYRKEMERRRAERQDPGAERFGRWGTGEAEITGLRLLDHQDGVLRAAETGHPLTIEIDYTAHQQVEDAVVGLGIHHPNGTVLSGPNTRQLELQFSHLTGTGSVRFQLANLPLLPGEYKLSASIYDRDLVHAYDHRDRAWPLLVQFQSGLDAYGCVQMNWKASARRKTAE